MDPLNNVGIPDILDFMRQFLVLIKFKERSQRSISDQLLARVSELYGEPLRWFLTLEDGDLGQESESPGPDSATPAGPAAAERIRRKIADAPASQRAMIEKVVEDMLDGITRVA